MISQPAKIVQKLADFAIFENPVPSKYITISHLRITEDGRFTIFYNFCVYFYPITRRRWLLDFDKSSMA